MLPLSHEQVLNTVIFFLGTMPSPVIFNRVPGMYLFYNLQAYPPGFLISISTLSQTGPTQTSTAPPVVYH